MHLFKKVNIILMGCIFIWMHCVIGLVTLLISRQKSFIFKNNAFITCYYQKQNILLKIYFPFIYMTFTYFTFLNIWDRAGICIIANVIFHNSRFLIFYACLPIEVESCMSRFSKKLIPLMLQFRKSFSFFKLPL